MAWAWWILASPLVSLVLIPLIPERKRSLGGWAALVSLFTSFLLSLKLAWPMFQGKALSQTQISIPWIALPGLELDFGLLIDPLSILMLLMVTGVGSTIFYYSLEYMKGDEGYRRYFTGLSLFAFSMIGIVLSSNLLQLFIFWELVGLSSYLLIGHWYQKPEAADAGKKAFLTNRVGDFGFLIGILLLWTFSGADGGRSLNLLHLDSAIPEFLEQAPAHHGWLTLAMILVFLGVIGKSAQFPLHVWLPDAMEGPTPVSALIHAATMVAAGVYLLARLFFLFSLSPFALELIAYIGALTALMSATQAMVQQDIKRILAYSTLSQLGYMVMAVGLGSSSSGMYHLTTHAFFKALLFLGAGSIIHASREQNIFRMGGLLKKMPFTSTSFLIGAFALIGFWPSSGFFSKEEILILALSENPILFGAACLTAFLTALYMGRLIALAFLGPSKLKKLHEPTHQMLIPLALLAAASLAGGFFGIEKILPSGAHVTNGKHMVVILSTTLGILGLMISFALYPVSRKAPSVRAGMNGNGFSEGFFPKATAVKQWYGVYRGTILSPAKRRGGTRRFFPPNFLADLGRILAGASLRMTEGTAGILHHLLIQKYYMDRFYDWILQHVQDPLAQFLGWFEKKIIVGGAVKQTAGSARAAGDFLRKLQTGEVQTYLTVFLGAVVILIYILTLG